MSNRSLASEPKELTWLQKSHQRAKQDKHSWDFAIRSGIAGGVAGCVAKTAVAPLDRVKILFQTHNADFQKYQGSFKGLYLSIRDIYASNGARGLLQGHLATLLRVFPYAGIKFMLYDRVHHYLMPTKNSETSAMLFTAGATSGIAAVFLTYPLELIRVRLAFQTKTAERTNLLQVVRLIYHENSFRPPPPVVLPSSAQPTVSVSPPPIAGAAASSTPHPPPSAFSRYLYQIPLAPFYRGFTITVLGMIPYAGISFLTYGRLKALVPAEFGRDHRTKVDLACGAVAGVVSQTASYPFEVVRRRMQVGGVKRPSGMVGWKETVRDVWKVGGWRGFYVGLGIGFLKVVPMTSISFTTWQFMKRSFDI
ncbi:mitochondrial carrier [Mrakia frigida]|uniref:coenzyme A transporter n=1 Tax=Mrakia frigida TaxID=29902 RepID=UPI003FCC15A1